MGMPPAPEQAPELPEIPGVGDNDAPQPNLEELLKAINSMDQLSREDKEEIIRNLLVSPDGNHPTKDGPKPRGGFIFPESGDLLLWGMLLVVILIIAFFGYKLYTALTDQERRREEKRRLKQQRKKK